MALSLVSLKDDALGEKVDLSDIYHQIKAISTIHEKLHQEGSIEHIDVEAYIDDLLSDVFSFYSAGAVTVVVNGNGTALEPDTMVHIGLIVNELATNAMKYGFDPDEETPQFTVELYREGESYVLTIANTGNPFPENIDLESPDTLGLQLVSALAGQMEGTIDLIRKPHPVFTLRFPVSIWQT
jgi:two-component sensor histidine kinase